MSGIASIFIAALAFTALAPLTAFASYSQQCSKSGNDSRTACEAAGKGAGAADAASAGQKAATTGSSPTVNPGAGAQSAQIAEQIARLQQAKQQCEAQKKKCESECDGLKAQAEGDEQARKKGEPKKVEDAKKKDCIGALVPLIAEIDKGLGNLGADSGGTNNTGQNSGSMPPIPPIPPSDKKDDKKSATDDPTANKPMVCGSDSTTTRYSDCNDYYVNKCSGNMGQDGCDQFISRYCGPMNGSGSNGGTTTTANTDSNFLTGVTKNPATANLVADKQGEGMGSSFCGKANGYRFCQASGRSSCPSCQNVSSWSTSYSSEQLKTAQNACPSDPIFSDPAVVAQMNQGTTTTPKDPDKPNDTKTMSTSPKSLAGGAGSSGSGSSGGKGGSGKASLGNDEGIAEGVATGPGSLDLNSGSGGGGGYHSEDEEKNEDKNHMGLQSTAAGRKPSSNLVSNSTDVANQYGPNLFSISTSTYKALCVRGRFLHCRER